MQAIDLSLDRPRPAVCTIRVGRGALDRLVEETARTPPGRPLFVVSDSNVAPLHARPLVDRLAGRGLPVELLTFPAGEASKTRRTKRELEDRLFASRAGRDAALLAVGGGVTGDLAGFVGATWQRGIPVVQVPTSLLAMVDAALGGKTAVNLPGGKNLVGAFHQPRGVYADTAVLRTLPEPFYRQGFAEVIKAAVIADVDLLGRLERSVGPLLRRSEDELEAIVGRCVQIKCDIVRGDERESGRRAVLNFGHTVGHALEAVTGYAMPHGAAVSIGMCVEARIAGHLTGFPEPHTRRLVALVQAFGLPSRVPDGIEIDALVEATKLDKKSRGGRARFALPLSLGRMPEGDAVGLEAEDGLVRSILGLN